MDFSTLSESVMTKLGTAFPSIVGAVLVLFIGWLVALAVRVGVRKGLASVRLNERLTGATGAKLDVEKGAGIGAFWVVFVLALIGFFNLLQIGAVSEPLVSMVDRVLEFVPSLLAAGILALIAWVVAILLRAGAVRGLKALSIDDKLAAEADVKPVSEALGQVVYGLVLLLFLPAVLEALGFTALLEPVRGVLDKTLGILPNLAAAVVLGLVGWVVGKILRNLVTNLLAPTGIDRIGERAGLKGTMALSALLGVVAFVFVFVPALIAALDVLQLEAIAGPATRMLEMMMAAIPAIFAAAVVLVVAFFLADFVGNLVTTLLGGLGADRLPERLGLPGLVPARTTLSKALGKIAMAFVILFAAVESAKLLGFATISDLVAMFIAFGGQVVLGAFVIGLGLWLANLVYDAIARVSRPSVSALAGLARITILALVLAMGLTAMNIGREIVILAFALPVGAVALAFALSFGLGGRKAAGKQVEDWFSRLGSAE